MSFLDEVGKIAGAVAAEQGMSALDPNANMLEKIGSAIAGYEGAKIAEEKFGEYQETHDTETAQNVSDDDNQDSQA